jgi:dephospho-CoA kinase
MRDKPFILGLTGSIGMGKSTVAGQLASLGARVCDADGIVHKLLGRGGAAVEAVVAVFPSIVKNGEVDRKALGEIVFHDKHKMKLLENILHPLVVAEENAFIERHTDGKTDIVVLEIPVLYETGAEKRCDAVVVVTAPPFIQKRRVLERPHMTPKRLAAILAMQVPDREKRRRADFVVQTGLGRAYSMRQVKMVVEKIRDARNRT